MNIFANKFAFIGILVLIIVLVMIVFLKPKTIARPAPTPSPYKQNTPFPQNDPLSTNNPGDFYSKNYKNQVKQIQEQEESQLQKDGLASKFMDSLPYQGKYISVTYTISNNQVTVIMDKSNRDLADKEFDELLLKNGIKDRNWIVDLVIK